MIQLSTTADPVTTGSHWHAVRSTGNGYATTVCGWLVIAYHLKKKRVVCPECLRLLKARKEAVR